jgi:hypothetical protein
LDWKTVAHQTSTDWNAGVPPATPRRGVGALVVE